MRINHTIIMTLALATAGLTTPAAAQEPDVVAGAWTATVQGGGLIADKHGNQTYLSAGLSHDFADRFTVGLAGSYTDGREEQSGLLALPSKTYEARLSANGAFGALSVGGYASYGRRTFSSASFTRRNGAVIDVGGSGPVFGVGGSLSYDLAIGGAFYLSPQATVAYDQADIARVFGAPGGGIRAIKDGQHGVTGTFGAAIDRASGGSEFGASAAFATSSNAAAYRAGSGQAPLATALAGKRADSWIELGAFGSLALNPQLALTGSAVRTLGFADDDGTTITAGLTVEF